MEEQIETVGPRRSLVIYAWIVVPVVVLGGLLVLTFFGTGKPVVAPPKGSEGGRSGRDAPLAAVRDSLARQTDLSTCRSAVSQANAHLQKARSEDRPTPLPAEQADRLKAAFGFDDDDLTELGSPTFTQLDAAHLETCFLLRDAARSLEVGVPGGRTDRTVAFAPIERARVAFDWVCRQIVLAPSPIEEAYQKEFRKADADASGSLNREEATRSSPELFGQLFDKLDRNEDKTVSEREMREYLGDQSAPPTFVLRRGSGTALERAIVFLALLEQFGIQDEKMALQGCLMFVPGTGGQKWRFWACAVVPADESKTAYLFDPRLGLPLPGPKGEGIATLKQARDDADVLGQLKMDKLVYDVTAEQAKRAEARTYAPLSALAPRMRLLQDKMLREPTWRDANDEKHTLPPAVRVRLAEDEPGALEAVKAAFVEAGGKADAVAYWREGGRLLRDFVGREGGGATVTTWFPMRQLEGFTTPNDTKAYPLPRARVLEFAHVPWTDFPPAFTDPDTFSFETGLGEGIRFYFARLFMDWLQAPNSAREMVVRGQFARAAPELSKEQAIWNEAKERGMEPDKVRQGPRAWDPSVREGVKTWVKVALGEYGKIPPPQAGQPPQTSPEVVKLFRWRFHDPMDVLMHGSMAGPRVAEVTYQLGLCKHEEAVRQQLRLRMAERAGVKTDEDEANARLAWSLAERWWRQYLRLYDRRPGATAARRLLGEVPLRQGQPEAAVQLWLAGAESSKDEGEKLGLTWRAKQGK